MWTCSPAGASLTSGRWSNVSGVTPFENPDQRVDEAFGLTYTTGFNLSLTAELACDARASAGIGPAVYAQELLAVAAESGGQRLRYGWTVGAGSRLSARIDALLASDRSSPQRRGGARLALGVVAAALAVTAVGASLRFTPLTQSGPPDAATDHQSLHSLRHRHF